ncbi:ABC transporter permease [Haloplasma contractile]|uniref:D-alanyl-D-alanine-endopeptidase penicillin-binding protein 4 n=1 Tax=Haloplasma contractile SSD-17B TaxID=1033810 RepID=U2EBA3_9MOLU|nr:ABC transporter permease [Haloplasma contractile]ERJ12066.1 D-alanyl-D-alanine-endopeptidase penicillin-binding protein 4 [Haloplasma contractile SSD-17B]
MYTEFIKNEFKKWLRDPLMKFMLFYPIVFGVIGRYVLPAIEDYNDYFIIDAYKDLIVVILALLIPLIYGALTGFSILDDRDDDSLVSIKVTPLSIHQFLSFRFGMVTVLSFLSTSFVMWFSDIGVNDMGIGNILLISLLASLSAMMTGMLINAFASNKIEGFAVMKGTGVILVFPIVSLFFKDSKEMIFSFAPGYWPAKAISSLIKGDDALYLNYTVYMFVGFVYIIFLNWIVYKLFLRRIKQ